VSAGFPHDRTTTGLTGVPRRSALLLLRHHVENGISVSLCFAVVVLAAGELAGFDVAIFVGSGAMCVSIVDQPGPLPRKARALGAALLSSTLVSLLASLTADHPSRMAGLVAVTSAGFAFVSAFGRTALVIGITAVLALITGMAAPSHNPVIVFEHSWLFFFGGAAYAMLALLASWCLDDRNRRMFLSEALLAMAAYLRARGRLYDRDVSERSALATVIERHGALMERLQAARDTIFIGRPSRARQRWIAGMLGLLDLYEAVLATDADWEALRELADADALRPITCLSDALANDIEALALILSSGAGSRPGCQHPELLTRLDEALAEATAAGRADAVAGLRPTRNKLAQVVTRTRRLAETIAPSQDTAPTLPAIDLRLFVQPPSRLVATLRTHLSLSSPVARYTIRLTLAMLAAYAVTVAFPNYVHGGWILLTVALIMRASYAVTRQRRTDRLIGTLAGCAVTAAVMPILPTYGVVAVIIVSIGVAHAFAGVNYKITSLAASLMALLLLHFLEPATFYVVDRIADTLIGAALSAVFARVLPSWEWKDVPRLASALLAADRSYAAQALTPTSEDQAYRLARKRVLDCFTTLATTTRRLSTEPHVQERTLISLNELLGANYLLASDLASVQGFLQGPLGELDTKLASSLLKEFRERVLQILSSDASHPPPESLRRRGWLELSNAHPLPMLRRRLLHIEHAARRVAAQARIATAGSAFES